MGDFFHGWRRKVGLLTLAMACAAMGLWARAFVIQDLVLFGNGQRIVTRGSVLVLLSSSAQDGFVWARQECEGITWLAGWQVRPTVGEDYFDPLLPGSNSLNPDTMVFHWQLFGFDIGRYHERNFGTFSFWRISYASVVLPSILISLWLLLHQPHKSTQKKIVEPLS